MLASKVSKRLRPSDGRAAAALRARAASISFCASSQASSRSMGCSFVPPETKPEDIAGNCAVWMLMLLTIVSKLRECERGE